MIVASFGRTCNVFIIERRTQGMVRKGTNNQSTGTAPPHTLNRVMVFTAIAAVLAAGCFAFMIFSDNLEADPATSGICGTDLTWDYDASTKTLTISGTGTKISDYSSSDLPWSGYKGNIETVIISDHVEIIGKKAGQAVLERIDRCGSKLILDKNEE